MTEEVKYFRCQGVGHLKQKYLNIEVEKKKKREKEAVYMARPQKQEKRPVCPIQEKAQEYCREESILPKGTLLLERRQITREMVAIYVDCGGCEGKGVQTYKNQEQGFLLERQVKNMQCGLC